MFFVTLGLIGVFTVIAVAILLYVSLAVSIGPWIDGTLALLSLGVLVLMPAGIYKVLMRRSLVIATIAASIGGIVASAVAWSLPTYFFLEPAAAEACQEHYVSYLFFIAVLVCAAGAVGIVVALCARPIWTDTVHYPFPIAQLVVKTLNAQEDKAQLGQLVSGAGLAFFYHFAQAVSDSMPRKVVLLMSRPFALWRVPRLQIECDLLPTYLAIGVIAGKMLAIPCLIGIMLKLCFMEPCYFLFFASAVTEQSFVMAFCTGLVLQGTVYSFYMLFKKMHWSRSVSLWTASSKNSFTLSTIGTFAPLLIVCCASMVFLKYLTSLSLLGLFYVVGSTVVYAYQIVLMMGRVGLAPLGRFATFVMVPGLLCFSYSAFQATCVAAFAEIACGVAACVASGLRVAHCEGKEVARKIYIYQSIGVLISALLVGVFLHFFVMRWGLGTAPLIAHRAQARALLVRAHEMHIPGLLLGTLIGLVLQQFHCNSTLVLTGIFMPLDGALLLIAGGLISSLDKRSEQHVPFWSGIFTTSSLWTMIRALLRR